MHEELGNDLRAERDLERMRNEGYRVNHFVKSFFITLATITIIAAIFGGIVGIVRLAIVHPYIALSIIAFLVFITLWAAVHHELN